MVFAVSAEVDVVAAQIDEVLAVKYFETAVRVGSPLLVLRPRSELCSCPPSI